MNDDPSRASGTRASATDAPNDGVEEWMMAYDGIRNEGTEAGETHISTYRWTAGSPKQQPMEATKALPPISQVASARVPSGGSVLKRKKRWGGRGEGKDDRGSPPVWSSVSGKEASALWDSKRVWLPVVARMTEGNIDDIVAVHNLARYSVVTARGYNQCIG